MSVCACEREERRDVMVGCVCVSVCMRERVCV